MMMTKAKIPYTFFRRNGLTLFFLTIFIITLAAQALTGWKENNQEIQQKGGDAIAFLAYLHSGHFISATFENFQSEFLQMGLYVLVTAGLRQQGSAESKSLDEKEDVDREPRATKDAPWPVKKGGWILSLYSSSLSICFFLLFMISWVLHLYGSWIDHNEQQMLIHQSADTLLNFLTQPTFWFETFQNWQSEFISIVSIVFLTIYLRQKGSPESKPVDAPHMQTGK
jgi:hypothetical protein